MTNPLQYDILIKMNRQNHESQVKFETLIAALSTDFSYGNEENTQKIIHNWMEKIAVTLEAEVSVLFLRHPKGDLFISDFWRKENLTKPVLYDPAQLFPYLTSAILHGEMVAVSSYNELPETAGVDKQNLQKMGTSSFIFFPMKTGNQILGAFLFAYKTKIVSWDETFIQKLMFIINIFSSVIKGEQDKKQLEERIQYESLLSDLSRDFISIRTDEIDEKITFWLYKAAETLGIDRALIFKLNAKDRFYLTTSWRSKDGKEVIPYDPEELFPWMATQLRQFKSVVIPDLEAFPKEASIDRENMNFIEAFSVLVLPLIVENELMGALAFSSTKTQFNLTQKLVQRLRIISQTFATALLRQKIEKDLAEEKERLMVTLKSIGDGVITTDISGNITLLNDVAEKLTGWRLAEAKGKPIGKIFNIINEITGKTQDSPVEEVIKTAATVTLSNHTLLVDKKGNRTPISDSGAPIKDSDGNILGVVLVFRDVTLEKKREADILKLKKLESVGILAGGIAHDFNNILTGILGNIDLAVLSKSDSKDFSKYLNNASKGCRRAASLTQKLLTFSKGGAPVKGNASIGEIVKESIEFIIHGSNIKAEWFIPEELWITEVDKHQISQVIQNLILNSMESMPDGGVISASCENITFKENHPRHGSYIMVKIKDTGTGISKENIDKIFDPYFTTKETGSGLGLAVTHSIIHKHGGFIDARSEQGKGTVFSIYLPVTGNQEPYREDQQKHIVNSKKHSFSVLVMDDDEMIRNILEGMLNKLGHTVFTVANGGQAIEKYKNLDIDLVILDITIPGGMGGIETMKQLKVIDSDVKTIISSGYSNSPVISDYKSYGFSESLTKPYLITELQTTIETVMNS